MHNLEINVTNKMHDIIRDIANNADQKDDFFVCRLNAIVEKFNQWRDLLPDVQPHYVVNCNNNYPVLRTLNSLGSSFSCSSKEEVKRLLSMGVNASRIIFSRPTLVSSDIKFAKSKGLTTMTFETENDLQKISTLYPEAKLIICSGQTEYKTEFKFGCSSIEKFLHLLKMASDLGLDMIGIKFHMYSGYRNADIFSQVVSTYLDHFNSSGFNLKLLDVGDIVLEEEDFFTVADEVRCIVNMYECFKNGSAKIVADVARFFVSSAYTLACKIDDIREVTVTTNNVHKVYHINNDKYRSFNCIYFDVPIIPKPLEMLNGKKLYQSSIWGPSGDCDDQIIEDVSLPELTMGDWLIFENMGAYTLESGDLKIIYMNNEDIIPSWENNFEEPEQFNDNIIVPNETSDLIMTQSNMITLPHYSDNSTAGNHRLKYIYLSNVDF